MFEFFKSKIKKAYLKLKNLSIGKKIQALFSKKIDDELFLELEKLFYESDLGVALSIELTEKIKQLLKDDPSLKIDDILKILKNDLEKQMIKSEDILLKKPHVIMIVGVNGSGKTTSIAKLANYYKNMKKKVLLVAADTFRAAAQDQLVLWAKKIGVEIVSSSHNADAASVVYDGLDAAKKRDSDIVIIDTAGRLHTKTNLMQELEKIKKVSNKSIESSPHETILIIDATTGQNAIDQAKTFNSYTPISSIFLSKLDGSAKGGVVLAIQKELKIPIKWIGIGEKLEDIEKFDSENFLDALFSLD